MSTSETSSNQRFFLVTRGADDVGVPALFSGYGTHLPGCATFADACREGAQRVRADGAIGWAKVLEFAGLDIAQQWEIDVPQLRRMQAVLANKEAQA